MSFQKNVDEKIEESIASGEFDDLPGKGKPLDLDGYFATPEHLRMGYSILKSADVIPEEMELLRQIEALKKSLDSCTTPLEEKALRQQLSEKLTNFNMRMEHNRKAGRPNQSHRSRSHDVVIRVYDVAGNMIETHQRAGDFPEF